MTDVPEVDARALGRLRLLGTGGQGKVLRLLDHADGPDAVVYKEYSPRVVDDVDVDALRDFVGFAHELAPGVRAKLLATTAWPEAVVRKDGVVVGFLMRKAPAAYTTTMRFGEQTSTELALVQFLLNPPEYLAARGLRLSPRFRYEFLHDTATALDLLHGLGISVGDLSPNNMLFSLTARPRGYFLDCDAMRLAGESVLPQVETPDWRISDVGPEELATPDSDTYKLGLLAVRLFANDQQSSDPRRVPVRLRAKVTASLRRDPDRRPSARSWVDALASAARDATDTSDTPPAAEVPPPRVPEDDPVIQPPAPPTRGRWLTAGVVSALVIGIITLIASTSTDTTPTRSAPFSAGTPRLTLPTYVPVPTIGLPTGVLPTVRVPINRLPSELLFPTADLASCLLPAGVAGDVRGGAGLERARSAVTDVVCEVNRTQRSHIGRIVLGPVSALGLLDWARIVGYWGEGTASPRIVAELTKKAGGCARVSLQFDSAYEVTSSGVVGTC
ncbi:hypothetical protein [Actinokineospora cianjurensis]|uniref:Serine/threonine protein kinase n=1 Tax=Actinokineospora cianjurensis TaxID=585224 RepID=A0A421B3V0_9PSEU|nr:hypothetical protein [Actinokineospora cianjurensis]RLK59047.1 serine/threonine protein kinase [Actinokineospora cianjurensis]